MRKLLKNNVPFVWSSGCEAELQYLKQCLISDPILKPMDPKKDLVLSTDGSVYGLGFCVLQKDDDDDMLHAVKYGVFSTTPHQANYSATTYMDCRRCKDSIRLEDRISRARCMLA